MKTHREFRRMIVDRKLDVQQLQSALFQTMRELAKDPAPAAAPVRLESVLIGPKQTMVYLSGNGEGLNAVAAAVRRRFPGAKISKARQADVKRLPRELQSTSW
jgi:hypothetical protein